MKVYQTCNLIELFSIMTALFFKIWGRKSKSKSLPPKTSFGCLFSLLSLFQSLGHQSTHMTSYLFSSDFTSGLVPIHARGCTQESGCKNSTGSILTVNYTLTMHCCNTDQCNGAASVQLSLTAALCAALMAIWSQWAL